MPAKKPACTGMPRFLLHGKTAVPVTMEREVARVLKLAELPPKRSNSADAALVGGRRTWKRSRRGKAGVANQVIVGTINQVTFLLLRSTTIMCPIQLRNAE